MGSTGGARALVLPFASGALAALAYPPLPLPVLAFVGLVPLLYWLDRPRSTRQVMLGGLAFALPYFGGASYWMFYLGRFTVAGIAGAAVFMVLQWTTFLIFPITVNLLRGRAGVPLLAVAPFAWTVSEHARAYGDLYFPWVSLGHTLTEWPALIQHADVVGIYGISWWLVLINALIAALLFRAGRPRRRVCAVTLAAALLLPAAYNGLRWRQVQHQIDGAAMLKLAIIQPDISQAMKWDPASASAAFDTIGRSIAAAERKGPAMVVGPEACVPLVVHTDSKRLPREIPSGKLPLLLGMVTGIGEGIESRRGDRTITVYREHFNSAVLAAPDRVILDRHDKQFLVPFTEQIPYKEALGFVLPFMRKQFGRFRVGENLHLMTLRSGGESVRFGALVCYESLFPRHVARLRHMGARFLVNITNDAWFGRSSFPYQHAGLSTLRAIENRIAIVRAANTGLSAFYDPLGRANPRSRLFREQILVGEVPLVDESTVYGRVGDVMLYLSYAVVAGLLFLAWRRGAVR